MPKIAADVGYTFSWPHFMFSGVLRPIILICFEIRLSDQLKKHTHNYGQEMLTCEL